MRETLFARWISLPPWVRLLGAFLLIIGVISSLQSIWSYRRHEGQKSEDKKTLLIDSEEQEELSSSDQASSTKKSGFPDSKSDSKVFSQKGLLIESDETEEFGIVKQSTPATDVTEAIVNQTPTPLPMPFNEASGEEQSPLAIGLSSQSYAAQTPSNLIAEARPTPIIDILNEVPTGDPNSPVKLAHYRFVLASTSFETSQSKENHLERVAALERLTQEACMSTLPRTLSYREPSSDPLCLAAIKQLLAMNPGSTTALCARDGIDSPSCYAADADTTFELPLTSTDDNEVRNRVEKSNIRDVNDQLAKSMAQMRSNSALASEEKKAQLKDETVKLAKKLLSIACAARKIGVRERPTVTGQDFGRREDPYGINDFLKERERNREEETMVQNPDMSSPPEREAFERTKSNQQVAPDIKNRETEKETSKPLGLVNLISSDCQSAIKTARSVDPTIALIPCAERGFYSPRCIQSLRAARDAEKRAGTTNTEGYAEDKGFSRF